MNVLSAELSRLTIVSPQSRVDLSIPSDVPFAEMLPTLLRQLGDDMPDEGAARGGWVLTRLDGDHLELGKSPLQLALRDGEVLHLANARNATPEMVFDDVIEAVATNTANRGSRWDHRNTRVTCLTLTAVALTLGIPVTALSGPTHLPAAITALAVAVALIAVSAVMARVYTEPRAAMVFSLPALGYAAVGGLTIMADRPDTSLWHPSHILLMGCVLLIFAAGALVAVPQSAPVMLSLLIAAGASAIAAGLALGFGLPPVAGAALVVPVALVFFPSLPMHALRLAKMPIPSLPTTVEQLKHDEQKIDGNRLLATAERAHAFHSTLLGALSAVCGLASVVVALLGGIPGMIMCAVVSLFLFLRVRPVLARAPRIPVLVAASAGMCAVVVAGFAAGDQLIRLTAVLGGLMVVVALITGYGMAVTGRQISPVWGRVLDFVEILLIAAVIPLAVWASDIYGQLLAVAG